MFVLRCSVAAAFLCASLGFGSSSSTASAAAGVAAVDAFVVVPTLPRPPPASRAIATTQTATTKTRTSKLFSSAAASSSRPIPDGLTKIVTQPAAPGASGSGGREVRLGDVATVKYACRVVHHNDDGNEEQERAKPFARSERQKVVVGDGSMIPGWDAALRTMTLGEGAVVTITDPNLAYGTQGVPGFVPANAQIEMDLEVLDVESGGFEGGGGEGMALESPLSRPRTPGAIAAAYEQRLKDKALSATPEKEGIEGWIDKAKSYYFFGLFEGETGQEAPWYLKPSITFPIAFVFVFLGFYVTLIGGGISERGAQVTDELDEIIVSWNNGGGGAPMLSVLTMAALSAFAPGVDVAP